MEKHIHSPRQSFAFAFVMIMLGTAQATIAGHTCETIKIPEMIFSLLLSHDEDNETLDRNEARRHRDK